MSKHVQHYFDAAKQQIPLLSEQEVADLLNVTPKVVVKKRFFNLKLLITMSMLISFFVGLMWLQQPTQESISKKPIAPQLPLGTTAQKSTKQSTQHSTKTNREVKPYIASSEPDVKPISGLFGPISLNANTTTEPTQTEQQPNDPERIYFNERGELVLTYEELAALGIFTSGKVLDYKVITDTNFVYTENGVKKSETPIFSFHVERGGTTSLNGMVDTLKGAYFSKFFAIAIEDSTSDTKYSKHRLLKTEVNMSRGYNLDYFNELKPHLVPVVVELPFKTKRENLIFWFKNEPDFIHALPDQIAQAVEQKYGPSKTPSYFYSIKAKYRSFKPVTKSLDSLTITNLQKKMIRVSDDFLKQLGITHTNKKTKLIFWESKTKNNKTVVSKSIYKNKGSYYYSTHQVWQNLNAQKGLSKVHNSPIAITNYSMSNFNFLRNIDDSIGPFMDNPSYSFFAKLAPQLHPILVDSNNVFWFPNSYLVSKTIQESNNQKAGFNLHKMNKLVLTPEALAKLNITCPKDGIRIPSYNNGVQSIYHTYTNGGSTAELIGFNFKPSHSDSLINFEIDTSNNRVSFKLGEATHFCVPVLVTDLTGIGWYQSELETDNFITKEETDYMVKNNLSPITYLPYVNAVTKAKELLTKQLSTFIPIVIHHPTLKKTGVIAWYKPDSIFLNLLPMEVSMAIKQELNAINTNSKGASCTYFEACKELGMNWEINAFPNPTERELNVTIENAVESKYQIEITDIEGKIVKDLNKEVKLPSGKHQLSYDISNLAKGMYLLQVINDKREILVKRIVKL